MVQKYLVSNRIFIYYCWGYGICQTMKERYENALDAIMSHCEDSTKVLSIKKVKRVKLNSNQFIDYNARRVSIPWNDKHANDIWMVTVDTQDEELLTRPIKEVHSKDGLTYLYCETSFGYKGGFQRIA